MTFKRIYSMTLHEVNSYLTQATAIHGTEMHHAALKHKRDLELDIENLLNIYKSKFSIKPVGLDLRNRNLKWLEIATLNLAEM